MIMGLAKVGDDVLDRAGGRLWDGYRSPAGLTS